MDDLISRDALLAAYDAAHKGPPGGARKLIEKAPAVDAEPVKRGKWVFERGRRNPRHCSECGFEEGIASLFYHYCPYCGAKMEVGE